MAYSGFAFFYSKDWSLFLFLKGVARQGRDDPLFPCIGGGTKFGPASHPPKQGDREGLLVLRTYTFQKVFFNYFVYSSGQSKILKSYFSAIAIFDFIRINPKGDRRKESSRGKLAFIWCFRYFGQNCHRAVRPNEIHFSSSFHKKITFSHLNLEIAKKSLIFAAQN